ncbi:MAG: hypothetical protein Q7U75_09385 [Desulfobacterales bacterium]|nr:hypothetical protein [Desulfobacterales bacterium]
MNSPANAGTGRKMAPVIQFPAGPEQFRPKFISDAIANVSDAHSKRDKLRAEMHQIHGWLDTLNTKMTEHVLRSQKTLDKYGPGSLAVALSTTPMSRYGQEKLRYQGQLQTVQQKIDNLSAYIANEDMKLAAARQKDRKLPAVHSRHSSELAPAHRTKGNKLTASQKDLETEGDNRLMAHADTLFQQFIAKAPGTRPLPAQGQSPGPQ